MDFSGLLHKANLNVLENYLIYGGDCLTLPNEKSYSQRLEDASKKASIFFETRYPDIQEQDEISGYFEEQATVFQEVYFEIGLLVGAKMGFKIREKMEELQ